MFSGLPCIESTVRVPTNLYLLFYVLMEPHVCTGSMLTAAHIEFLQDLLPERCAEPWVQLRVKQTRFQACFHTRTRATGTHGPS